MTTVATFFPLFGSFQCWWFFRPPTLLQDNNQKTMDDNQISYLLKHKLPPTHNINAAYGVFVEFDVFFLSQPNNRTYDD